MTQYIKQKCPTCGERVDVLYTNKRPFDSCIHCHPTAKGKTVGRLLHELNEKRKKADNPKKQKKD